MNEAQFQILSDAELELAAGGSGISLTIDKSGVALAGPLGEVKIPNPLTIVGKLVGGTLAAAGGVLEGAGGALGALGSLFGR